MKAFRAPGRLAYKVRIALPDGRKRVCGCDTRAKTVADTMARWVTALRYGQDRRMDVVEAIVTGKVRLSVAYDQRRDLDGLMARVGDMDLQPFVAKFAAAKAKARKGGGSAEKYRAQVKTLLAPGVPFMRSRFTTSAVRKHLASLDCDDATRNRYKAAFSAFARYLVDHDVIERNIVRDIPGWPGGEPRCEWYMMEEAHKVVAALPQPFAAVEALMCATGIEWQAVERLTVADVDLRGRVVTARGSKTRWRNRTAKMLEVFAWCQPYIAAALVGKLPGALAFEGITERDALRVHHETCEAVGVRRTRLHDWRHTHAVLALKAGYPVQGVAAQLGHKDATMVWRVYGKYVPTVDEMIPRVIPKPDTEAASASGR